MCLQKLKITTAFEVSLKGQASRLRGEFVVAVVNQSAEKNQTISREGFTSGEFTLIYVPQEELRDVLEAQIRYKVS